MKKFIHDYTLPSKADMLLQEAQVKIKWNNYWDANIRINEAREILQKYLSGDNMVEDDDVCPGCVNGTDTDKERIRAEVERLLKDEWCYSRSSEGKYRREAYKEILGFIDSLSEKEKENDALIRKEAGK